MTEPLVYTVAEAAKLLHVSESHIRTLAHTGALPTVPHMGRRILIPRAGLEQLVAGAGVA